MHIEIISFSHLDDSSAIIKLMQSDQALNISAEFGDALHHYKPIHLAAELSENNNQYEESIT